MRSVVPGPSTLVRSSCVDKKSYGAGLLTFRLNPQAGRRVSGTTAGTEWSCDRSGRFRVTSACAIVDSRTDHRRVSEISCVRHNMRSPYAPQTENLDA